MNDIFTQVVELARSLGLGKLGSLTTSSPEDAPRGMEFLYSLNRLNVATSRAMSAVIVVGSPKLFEPECRSPRQMQLANALCAYLEMAETVDLEKMM